jgi:hypothetical protein
MRVGAGGREAPGLVFLLFISVRLAGLLGSSGQVGEDGQSLGPGEAFEPLGDVRAQLPLPLDVAEVPSQHYAPRRFLADTVVTGAAALA